MVSVAGLVTFDGLDVVVGDPGEVVTEDLPRFSFADSV